MFTLKSNVCPNFETSISGVSVVIFFQAYSPDLFASKIVTVPSSATSELPSEPTLPSSSGAPTNTLLSITHTPLPKSSFADTLVVTNLSSIINLVLYFVAVYAPPEPVFESTNLVSCKSKVVASKSNNICLLLPLFSAPITSLVASSFMSIELPNLLLICPSGALIVCCNVYASVLSPSASHL